MISIVAIPLTREAFAPFGEVIEPDDTRAYPINGGRCMRHHALATAEAAGEDARVILSIFRGQPYVFPLTLDLVERHPLGSQCFVPLSPNPFLVVVCPDEDGRPGMPRAFATRPGQGVNYPRNLWHAVLTPIGQPQDFLVVDRAGDGNNLEEFRFDPPYQIRLP
ncbi:MAG: ureidoglycolate lyase [Rhizobiaceae bacterium]|nr:ureidoglycolate lyase [Rhizobiaceae bacterium]